jgi:methylmalonyl-CoA mutase N-terminal domain/subunit
MRIVQHYETGAGMPGESPSERDRAPTDAKIEIGIITDALKQYIAHSAAHEVQTRLPAKREFRQTTQYLSVPCDP